MYVFCIALYCSLRKNILKVVNINSWTCFFIRKQKIYNFESFCHFIAIPVKHAWHFNSIVPVGDKFYIACGPQCSSLMYDTKVDNWTFLKPTLPQHSFGEILHIEGKIHLFWGDTKHENCMINEATSKSFAYDIEKDQWGMCEFMLPRPMKWLFAATMKIKSREKFSTDDISENRSPK